MKFLHMTFYVQVFHVNHFLKLGCKADLKMNKDVVIFSIGLWTFLMNINQNMCFLKMSLILSRMMEVIHIR